MIDRNNRKSILQAFYRSITLHLHVNTAIKIWQYRSTMVCGLLAYICDFSSHHKKTYKRTQTKDKSNWSISLMIDRNNSKSIFQAFYRSITSHLHVNTAIEIWQYRSTMVCGLLAHICDFSSHHKKTYKRTQSTWWFRRPIHITFVWDDHAHKPFMQNILYGMIQCDVGDYSIRAKWRW